MDTMKIESAFMKSIVEKWLSRQVQRKLGADVKIYLNDFNLQFDGSTGHVNLTAGAKFSKETLKAILKETGL